PHVEAWKLLQPRIQLAHEILLSLTLRPGLIRRQRNGSLDMRWRPGIDGRILAAELRDDGLNFREFANGTPKLARHVTCGFERKAARQLDLEPEAAFIQVQQIVATDLEAENHDANNRDTSRRIGQRRPIQQTPQRRAIGASQRFERLVAKRTARLPKRQVGK